MKKATTRQSSRLAAVARGRLRKAKRCGKSLLLLIDDQIMITLRMASNIFWTQCYIGTTAKNPSIEVNPL
jgi:hypothetical protein